MSTRSKWYKMDRSTDIQKDQGQHQDWQGSGREGVEEQTELGSGFDEPGTVKYKKRTNDSDKELDDLDRRKKRELSPGYRRPKPPRMPTPKHGEHDEDNNKNQSKYNLWRGRKKRGPT